MAQGKFTHAYLEHVLRMVNLGTVLGYGKNQRLYVNDFTGGYDSVTADFTQCTLTGYAAVDLGLLSWTFTTGGGSAVGVPSPVVYTFSAYGGPLVTIYGVYWTGFGSDNNALVYSQRFDVPFVVPLAGGVLPTYPSMRDQFFLPP